MVLETAIITEGAGGTDLPSLEDRVVVNVADGLESRGRNDGSSDIL